MSEFSHSDDELLSSHLDGDLTAEEGARLEQRLATEPALNERLDALRAAAALASTSVSPLAGPDSDRLIAAALDASATASNVTDLTSASSRRRVWPTRIATAAAGVVALALSVSVLQSIDTGGSDNDAGDTDTGSAVFDEVDAALNDSTDDDTAGDMALESQMAAEDEADFDAGSDTADIAEGSQDGPDDSAFGGPEMSMANAGLLRLFEGDPSFDPLADDLGEFASTQALAVDLSGQWTNFRLDREAATTTTSDPLGATDPDTDESPLDRDELLAVASGRLDSFNSVSTCDSLADLIIDYFAEDSMNVIAADYASVTIDGSPGVVGLFQLSGDDAVVLVIDLTSCELLDLALN